MKKAKRMIVSSLTAIMMTVQLCPPVSAAETVSYKKYSWDIYTKQLVETTETTSNYTVVTGELAKNNPNGLPGGTYVVNSDTTIEDYVYVQKDKTVNLIVKDGVTLTCKKGIGCGYNKKNKYAALNIYGTGKIVTTGKENAAGIGGNDDETNGYITIHGTTIEATGGKHAAGIGGGEGGKDPDANSPTITIYAGDITTTGGVDGAGIGGGDEQPGARTYIYSGKITAESKKHGAGIGGGDDEGTFGIWIYGGEVTATGGYHGAGIGAGEEGGNLRDKSNGGGINILGGTVTATGGSGGAGIGGGYDEDMSGTIDISGDDTKITANGGYGSAGIGAGKGNSSDWCVPEGDMKGTITIECGKQSDIKVTGGGKSGTHEGGAGIGAGFAGNMTGKVYIKGGNIEITSGDMAAGIGGGRESGKYGGEGGDVYIGGGNITINTINSFWYKEDKSHAIGCGVEDAKDGSVYFKADKNATEPSYMRVEYMPYDKDEFKTASASDRSKKCHTRATLRITECDHTGGLNSTVTPTQHVIKCKYCGYEEKGPHDEGLICHCGYKSSELESMRYVTLNMIKGDAVTGATEPMATALLVKIGTAFEIPECEYTPKGRRFTGWALNNTSVIKQPGDTITITAETTLTAQYAELFKITRANYGTIPHGDIDVDKYTADKDDEITVTSYPEPGYKLKTVIVKENNESGETLFEQAIDPDQNGFTFPMPAQDVYITAEFEKMSYVVSWSEETENGTVSAAPKKIFTFDEVSGEDKPTVTITASPDDGYRLSKLSLKTKSGIVPELTRISENEFTFTMPQENVSVSVEFEEADDIGERLYGYSISLDGDIGVNFYMELEDDVAASPDAYMEFTIPNGNDTETQTVYVNKQDDESLPCAVKKNGYYVFKCRVSAKDMASNITARMKNGDNTGNVYTYSVKEYADYLLAHTADSEEYAKAAPLVKAMLNYGTAAQTYFNVDGTAANSGLSAEDKNLGDVTMTDPGFTVTALADGVTFEGATLSLKSQTTLSFYFTGLDESTEFSCEGYTAEKATSGDYLIIRVRGIKAKNLADDITLTFGGSTVTYCPMTYCYNVLNDSGNNYSENLINVCKALYRYCEAAKVYFA